MASRTAKVQNEMRRKTGKWMFRMKKNTIKSTDGLKGKIAGQ